MNQEVTVENRKTISLPIEITFDLQTDSPETSGLMTSLRQIGFNQESVGGTITRVKYKGTFTGTLETLEHLVKAVKGHRTKV